MDKLRVTKFLLSQRKKLINLQKEQARLQEFLDSNCGISARSIYAEYMNSEFRNWFLAKKAILIKAGERERTSDFDCQTLYLLVRLFKPRIVVETGVKYGASSAHILEALHKNGTGRVYSFDFPQRLEEPFPRVFFIRETTKDMWEFIVGEITKELPGLLEGLDRIDFFFHDSSHSFQHMLWEYKTVYSKLADGGILSSHDVLSLPFQKNAFAFFCRQCRLDYRIFKNVGIAFMSHKKITENIF